MELVAEYRKIDEPRRESLRCPGYSPEWETFHNSEDHKISVFAGRRMGKTYNLALRAVQSKYDCVIFVSQVGLIHGIYEQIMQMSTGMELQHTMESRGALIRYENGRSITVETLPRNDSMLRGRNFNGNELMFDEFDNMWFARFLDRTRDNLDVARHIVCVGSMYSPYDSQGKRWFKESGTKCFIDSPYEIDELGYMRHEFFPSEQQQLIEQLPPVFYES